MKWIKGTILSILLLSLMACGIRGNTKEDYYKEINEAVEKAQTISAGMISILEANAVEANATETGEVDSLPRRRENEILLIFDKEKDTLEYEYYSMIKDNEKDEEIHLKNNEMGLYSYHEGNQIYEAEPTDSYYLSCMDKIRLYFPLETITSIVKTKEDAVTYYDVTIDADDLDGSKLTYRYGMDQDQCVVYLEIIQEGYIENVDDSIISKIIWELHY